MTHGTRIFKNSCSKEENPLSSACLQVKKKIDLVGF
jgi:hypothetical protein